MMRKERSSKSCWVTILLVAFFMYNTVAGQENPAPHDTYYNTLEPVTLQLSKIPHGSVQWQESSDQGASWSDIEGANASLLEYSTGQSMSVRSIVISGTCDTVISQVVKLKAFRLETVGIDSITANSAYVTCAVETGDANITTLGILYATNENVGIEDKKVNADMPVTGEFGLKLAQLNDEATYYVRGFGITEDEEVIYGNTIRFNPIKISFADRLNIFTDTAQLKYTISGLEAEELDEHGILVNTVSGSVQTSISFSGVTAGEDYAAIARNLDPGTKYYVTAYLVFEGTHYYSQEIEMTTWSDYNDPVDNDPFTIAHTIAWEDPSTAKRISQTGMYGDYGRVERIGKTDTLLLAYHGGPNSGDWINIYLRKSFDNGETWEDQEIIMDLSDYTGQYWRFCTPELLFMNNGWIMLAFEANARPDENQSEVQILISKDSAQTWEDPIKYVTGRSWEPAMVQLPNGEIELFYSCEAPWWGTNNIYQDIRVIRSTDNGMTWSDPQIVAYYPQKRDGMPVPLQLDGNKGVVFAIECVNTGDSPYIIHRDMDSLWELTTSNFTNSPNRWYVPGFSGHGGAPYILQLPTGETVLSAHIYRGGDWHQNNYQQVMVGDNGAKNFKDPQNPWDELAWGEGAVNNSLFLKDDTTVVTISTRMFSNGTGAIYWLEGKIVPE